MPGRWPALAGIIAAGHSGGPPRTGSTIVTVFGDAIAPRGGEIALTALLRLMRRLGSTDSSVRTALSRLTVGGWLDRTRLGSTSFYRLAPRGIDEFALATPRIYGPLTKPWDGRLRIVFAELGTDRVVLEQAGFALVAPGVLVSAETEGPPGAGCLSAAGPIEVMRSLAARAWPLHALAADYADFIARFHVLGPEAGGLPPLEALCARVLLINAYRRIVLRDPRLPTALLPSDWPGQHARELCSTLYISVADASEAWLDSVANASGPLPRGPDARLGFSDGDS